MDYKEQIIRQFVTLTYLHYDIYYKYKYCNRHIIIKIIKLVNNLIFIL